MYAAVAYLEKKQIQRNISIAGTKGRQVTTEAGGTSFEINDPYRVLEDITNTPKFWMKKKYEMLAKLDNLGAFQIFFTIACC